MAAFRVVDVFGLNSPKRVVIVGDVTESVVEAGMVAEIHLPNGIVKLAPILSVEFADYLQSRKAHAGLVCLKNPQFGITASSLRSLIGRTITVNRPQTSTEHPK